MNGTLVLLSGGMDSTVLATETEAREARCEAVSFDYGQRHRRELTAAAAVAERLAIRHHVLDLTGLLGQSALTGEHDVPEGRYDDESMRITVVPGRNLLFLASAIALAARLELDEVALAVHAGDHPIYPDCRPAFVSAVSLAAAAYDVSVFAPFVRVDKAEIVRRGMVTGAPLELSWSCYLGGERHCGRCGTCVERHEAFRLAHAIDPTSYVDDQFARVVAPTVRA